MRKTELLFARNPSALIADRRTRTIGPSESHCRQENEIKGPILQYELRIYRLWKCPKCGRTVRTRGAVTSRRCTCAEPEPVMQAIDRPPVGEFDSSPFVTYMGEEDTTPTEAELVEDLPEREVTEIELAAAEKASRPRRGKGYLRAEPTPVEKPDKPKPAIEEPESEFGAGIEDDADGEQNATRENASAKSLESSPAANAEAPLSSNESQEVQSSGTTESSEEPNTESEKKRGRRRRPRRRRDRNKRPENKADGSGSSPQTNVESGGAQSGEGQGSLEPAGDAKSGDGRSGDSPGRKKRRRRPRRRRGQGGNPPSAGESPKPSE